MAVFHTKSIKMSLFSISHQDLANSAIGKIVVPVSKNADTTKLADAFESYSGFDSLRIFEAFDAKTGNFWRVFHDSGEIILVGIGDAPGIDSIYKTFRKFSHTQRKILDSEIGVFIHPATLNATSQKDDEDENDISAVQYDADSASSFPKSGTSRASGIGQNLFQLAGNARTTKVNTLSLLTECIVNGLITGTNSTKLSGKVPTGDSSKDSYDAQNENHPLEHIVLLTSDLETSSKLIDSAEKARIIAEAQLLSMHFINIPSNRKNPVQFADDIRNCTEEHDIECEIYDEVRLKNEGFDALLSVNRGSEFPARFVILRYNPRNAGSVNNPAHIALVGKGVTFDSGGLSIKPSESMPAMKCDMAGASIVVSATIAVARLQLPVKITTVIPLTDNLVDACSVKPGDIIDSYSGKTIEIIDTDAEGRLILADALSWVVRNTDARHILDFATLTGSTVRTFGTHAAGVFSNDAQLLQTLLQSSSVTGEKLWPLPIWDDYKDEITSDVASVRNFSGKPTAGAISAAKFLQVFIDDHSSWAHLDVAGTVFGDTEFGKQKNATGYGIRLITEVVKQLGQ